MQKKEKKRWLFRKPTTIQESVPSPPPAHLSSKQMTHVGSSAQPAGVSEQRSAVAAALATTAAAEVAIEVARRSKPPVKVNNSRHHYAATIIQTAFRGYLVSVNSTQI